MEQGIIETNPTHGLRKPKYKVRTRRLREPEYGTLEKILSTATAENPKFATTADIVRLIAMTGCRRGEIIELKWAEIDFEGSCLRLQETKEGASVRPVGLAVIEFLERLRAQCTSSGEFVFSGPRSGKAFGSFPNHWEEIFYRPDSELPDITAHVLRHSFASVANDLGFTEVTIAALMGHSKGSVTSKYIHTLDATLVTAADTISGYIRGLLDGIAFRQTAYAFDRNARRLALARFLQSASGQPAETAGSRLAETGWH